MNQILLLNPEQVTEEEVVNFQVREAARAVVFDGGKIALEHASKYEYYKLPGGGIEDGENALGALSRECKEEIGCAIKIIAEVGKTVEYRKFSGLKQTSYCYLAKNVGDRGQPTYTSEEKAAGFEVVWVPIAQALALLKNSKTDMYESASYIVPRDTAILEAALKCYPQE
jgi:8-oxo-dGTP diphosphatase